MANEEQNPPQQEQPFVAAKQVSFSVFTGGIYGKVGVNTFRNAIGIHYLPHSSKYVAPPSIDIVRPWFETTGYEETVLVKGILKKSLLPPKWILLMVEIIQCLGGKTEGCDQITNKDAIILYSLVNRINIDYVSIFLEDVTIKLNKRHREKVVPYTRFLSLLMMHKMKEGYRDGEVTPYPTQLSHKEAAKGGSSKSPTGSKTGHLKRKKDSSSAMDSNPSQTSASTPVVAEMHKEDQQATGGPTSLGVTSEARANPQLSSGIDPYVLTDKTQSISEGLEIVLTQPTTGKGASSIARWVEEDEASRTIKLEDLAKLVSSVQLSFKDLDSLEDDHSIVVDHSNKDEEADEVHATTNSQKHKLELEKNKAEAEAAFPNAGQLNELLVKSLQTEFSKILSAYDFSSSLPTELKELPSKFNELTEEVKGLKKQVHELEIELPGDLKEFPSTLEDFTRNTRIVTSLTSQVAELKTLQWELPAEFLTIPTQVEKVQAKLKTLDALPSLLNKVTYVLNQFAQAIASKKTEDTRIPLAGQAGTQPAEGEKYTNQTTISQLF
ncbi:hypothetical protein Tco_1166375 [Tanacetum coccineum]